MAATVVEPLTQPVPARAGEPARPPAPPTRLERLRVPMPDDRALSWLCTGVVTALAAVLRLWGIGWPHGKQFDELYYATEGTEILQQGYENNPGYMFIVHPPLGKWLIGAGIWFFNDVLGTREEIGWRVPSAIAGTLAVLITVRVVRRMTRSTLLGVIAGVLLACDGLFLVQSRFALLDIFIALFVVAGFACLVVDRDKVRERLADAVEAGRITADGFGPRLGWRPWRLAGGVLLGLACSVKWSGVYFLAGFAVLSVVWDITARRAAGITRPWRAAALLDLPNALARLAVAPVAAYLLSWSGWFLGENSYGRHWADTHAGYWSWLPGPIRSLIHYHVEMWNFHKGLDSPHAYQSTPWSWLVTGRPVLFYYPSKPSPTGCGEPNCVRTVLDVGTPALWWAFIPALLWLGWLLVTRWDWRAGALLVAFAAGWLTWFRPADRTMFLFYMTPLVPFLVMGVTIALGSILGRARASENRRLVGLLIVSGYVALVVVNFAWLWPILTGQLMTYDEWHSRMWFPSWI